MIEFFHPFIPPKTTSQQRRQSASGGYLHHAGRIARATWQAVLEPYRPETPLAGPLRLEISLTWPHTRESAGRARKRGVGAVPKTTRPDGDNLVKMIKDVMQKLGYFPDDARIYDERVTRWHGDYPGVFVRLESEE